MKGFFRKASAPLILTAVAAVFFGCARKPVEGLKAWETYLYDDSRSNVSSSEVGLPLVLKWKDDIATIKLLNPYPKEQLAPPAISNGALYIGSQDERFYSFDLDSGKLLWRYDAGTPLDGPASAAPNTVCFGSSDGFLRCLDTVDGRELWRFQARSEIISAPVIRDGRVYFTSSDSRAYAVSFKDGSKLWSYSRTTFQMINPRLYNSPAYSNGRLFILFPDGYLVALDAESGKELWSRKAVKAFDSGLQTRRTPLVDRGEVYVIDDNNAISAYGEETGELKGSYNFIKAYDFITPDARTMIALGAKQVVSIDRLTGSILWKEELKEGTPSTMLASGGIVFIVSNIRKGPFGGDFMAKDRGRIQALRIKDGAEVWSHDMRAGIKASAAYGEERLAFITNMGILSVFKPR